MAVDAVCAFEAVPAENRPGGSSPAGGNSLVRSLVLLLVAVTLGVFSISDADGDPMTSNGPGVVLTAETGAVSVGECSEALGGEGSEGPTRLRRHRHALLEMRRARWLEWRPRIRPIRGP